MRFVHCLRAASNFRDNQYVVRRLVRDPLRQNVPKELFPPAQSRACAPVLHCRRSNVQCRHHSSTA